MKSAAVRIDVSGLPDWLRNEAPFGTCGRCKATVMWTVRADKAEVGSPLHPTPTTGGNLVILGFTLSGADIVPLVADVRRLEELPDWDALPEWARRKRWIHHAPECRGSERGSLRRM